MSIKVKKEKGVTFIELAANRNPISVSENARVYRMVDVLQDQILRGFIGDCEDLGYYMVPSFRTDQ